MSDRQTPMEPAELLTVSTPKAEPKDSYGTAILQRAKKHHTGLIFCICVVLILLATVFAGIRLARKRLIFSDGKLVLRSAIEPPATEKNPPEWELLPNENAAHDRGMPDDAELAHDSLQLGTPAPNSAEGQSLQALYQQTASGVVCVTGISYGGKVTGTGIVLDENGFVLTTEAAVSGVSELQLITQDGATVAAQLIGIDRDTGFVLLHGELEQPQPVCFGNPSQLRTGQPVYSIGNPYGEQMRNVLSEGILSGIGSLPLRDRALTLLDSNAVFATDNTGCPLFDSAGNVIGVTAAVGDPPAGSCFAVGADDVQRIAQQIMENAASADDRWLGFEVGQIPEAYRFYYGFPGTLWITSVGENTHADGVLAIYDVILSVDGVSVSTVEEYEAALASHQAGEYANLRIYRGGLYYRIALPLTDR